MTRLFTGPTQWKRRGRPSSLLTSLAAFWKQDEASSTRADATANARDLTDNNTVTSTTGKPRRPGRVKHRGEPTNAAVSR